MVRNVADSFHAFLSGLLNQGEKKTKQTQHRKEKKSTILHHNFPAFSRLQVPDVVTKISTYGFNETHELNENVSFEDHSTNHYQISTQNKISTSTSPRTTAAYSSVDSLLRDRYDSGPKQLSGEKQLGDLTFFLSKCLRKT